MLCSDVCLVPKGDTPTSSRFYSAVACGCVPLVLSDDLGHHLPFSRRVNYSFVQYLREKDFVENPRAAVSARMGQIQPQLPALRQLMREAAPDLLFEEEGSRVADNMLHEYALACQWAHAGARPLGANGTHVGYGHRSHDSQVWPHGNQTPPAAPPVVRPPASPAPPAPLPWWLAGFAPSRSLVQR